MKDLRNHNILVVGSSNTDMVVKTNHLPRPGETVLGGTFFIYSDINPSSYLRKRGLILPIFSQIRRIHLA